MKTPSRLRIIVLGYEVRGPFGGMAWHHLQYVMGLARLGHDVYFIEDSDDYASCYDPSRGVMDTDPTYGLRFAGRAFKRVGLGDRWAYYDAHTTRWHGPCADRAPDICSTSDLLLNLSGVNPIRPWMENVPARALIDTDPAFTQVRHLTDPSARALASKHTAFFSFGESIPAGTSTVPRDGLPWQATRQPVVLDAWPVTPGPARGRFTTVMQWDSYPPREHDGVRYGMKSDSFADYIDLPAAAGPMLELAVGGPTAPRSLLRAKGWAVRDPGGPSRDPWSYQRYIRRSRAEFGVAKHGYVVSRCGWFSERSACYLASGRPALLQDTGFSAWLPSGECLIPFRDPAQALEGIERINAEYDRHCRAAREIAEECFDSGRVLPGLIEHAMNPDRAAAVHAAADAGE